MEQVILWGYVELVGLAIAAASGWARRPLIGCLLAFPLGLTACVYTLVACLWLGAPLAAAVVLAAVAPMVAAGAAAWRRRGEIDRRAIALSAMAVAMTAAVAALAAAFPFAVVTENGHRILLAATAIARSPLALDLIWNDLPSPPVFHASLHAAAPALAGRPFFAAFAPLCALSCALLLAAGGSAMAARWCASRAARAVIGVALAAALASFLFLVQGTAVDLHAATALFLIAFLVAHTLGAEEGAPPSIWAELLLLLGLAVQGFAAAIAASALLLAVHGGGRRVRPGLVVPTLVYTVALTLWHLWLWVGIGRGAPSVTPEEALVVTAAPLAAWLCLVAVAGVPARRALAFAAAGLMIVVSGLLAGWDVWTGEAGERWTDLARWIGRFRPGLSDCLLLGLFAICVPLARGPAGAAAASVVALVGVQIFADAGAAHDPRELAGPLRVAAAAPALLVVMLTAVRLLAGRGERPDDEPAAEPHPTAPAGLRDVRRAVPLLFASVVAVLVLTNVRLQIRVHRLHDESRQVLSSGPTSLADDDLQFVYYLVGARIPGATVVIPRRLADHAVFFRVLGRVDVEIADVAPRLSADGAAALSGLRLGRRTMYYEVATVTELVYLVPAPRSQRYVLAEYAPSRHFLVPEPLFFWLATPETAPSAAAGAGP